jgi:hypothetical protein
MEKYLLSLLICVANAGIADAQAYQIYKSFKTDIGFGAAYGVSQPESFLMYMEPSYTFANNYKAGIRLEQSISNMKQIGSYAITFDYYIPRTKGFRAFAGTGYSYFNITGSGGCDPGPTTIKTVSRTGSSGALFRTGLEVFHFRLGIEYNLVPPTHVSMTDLNGQSLSRAVYSNAYFGFKAGLCIGGGKKK